MENQNSESGQQTINTQVNSIDNFITNRRTIIPISFALAIIFFFFTFCDFKCGGQTIGSATGINLVTGTELKDKDLITGRETKGQEIPANIWAIFAFGASIIGLGAFMIKEKREDRIGVGSGAIGAGSLIILKFVIESASNKKGAQIDVDFQFAYWGALCALAVAGVISYLRMQRKYDIILGSPPSSSLTSQTIVASIPQKSNFDLGYWLDKTGKSFKEWLNKNRKITGEWYFILNNKPIGPIEEHQIAKFMRDGVITQRTKVWRKGMQGWVSASDTDLIKQFGSVQSPKPKENSYCGNCGSQLSPKVTYCNKCGSKVKTI